MALPVIRNGLPLVNADGIPALCKPEGCCGGAIGDCAGFFALTPPTSYQVIFEYQSNGVLVPLTSDVCDGDIPSYLLNGSGRSYSIHGVTDDPCHNADLPMTVESITITFSCLNDRVTLTFLMDGESGRNFNDPEPGVSSYYLNSHKVMQLPAQENEIYGTHEMTLPLFTDSTSTALTVVATGTVTLIPIA